MDSYIGQIILFAGPFAPDGWMFCDGQLLSISDNQVLFSILGSTYGGDGRTNFALPDLRGRVPIHSGTGPGLSPYDLGQKGGAETHTLTTAHLPAHTHPATATSEATPATVMTVGAKDALANDKEGCGISYDYQLSQVSVNVQVGEAGGGQPVPHRQPYLSINYIISVQGTYPSRS